MNVVASMLTQVTAKTAHKSGGASSDGSKSGDFAAMLEGMPDGAKVKALGTAARHGAKAQPAVEETAAAMPVEAQAAETTLPKAKGKQGKAARNDESGDTTEPKAHAPSEHASAIAAAVVPVATAQTDHIEGAPTKGSVISTIASGKGKAPASAKAATADDTAPAVSENGTPIDATAPTAPGTDAALGEQVAVSSDQAVADGKQTDGAAPRIKPGEATELLRQLNGAFEKKAGEKADRQAGEKAQAQSVPQTAQTTDSTAAEAMARSGTPRAEAGRRETARSVTRGAEADRAEVIRRDVARSDAAVAESGRSDLAAGKAVASAPRFRANDGGNANAVKSADGTAVAVATDATAVAQTSVTRDAGKQSGRRDERDQDEKKVARSSESASAAFSSPSAANAVDYSAAIAPGDTFALQPGGAVAAALGQQVIDMGVSGQWLDSIAHQIATVAASNGQGSFSIAPESLGDIRVNITQGDAGATVHMTVDNEAARLALMQDSDRLLKDAQLSSVRIADVQVDMVAQVGSTHSGNMDQNGQGQQPGSQNPSGWTSSANGNASGQGQRQAQFAAGGQGADSGSGGNQPKFGSNNAVSADMKRADSAGARVSGAQRARYA